MVLQTPGAIEQSESPESPIPFGDGVHPPLVVPVDDIGDKWTDQVNDELAVNGGAGFSGQTTTDSGLYWDELRGSPHCLAYGTRRYTARLQNVPFWTNRTRVCMEAPIQINGLMISSPDECDDHASFIICH